MYRSLLDLPTELRAHIIQCLIHDERPPTHDFSDRMRNPRTRYTPYFNYGLDRVDYEPFADVQHKPNVLNLLLTNHQLYDETKHCLSLSQYVCKVDAAIISGRTLRPTFTCIPTKCRIIDVVFATIHIAGKGPACGEHWRKRERREGPGMVMWLFWELLRDFVRFGPYPPLLRDGRSSLNDMSDLDLTPNRCPAAIRVLDINVTDPDDPCGSVVQPPPDENAERPCRCCRLLNCRDGGTSGQPQTFNAEGVYDFVSTSVQLLLEKYDFVFAVLTYTRIGSIRMRMRGVLVGEIDLGDLLMTLRLIHGKAASKDIIRRGRKYRIRNGLSCPEEGDERLQGSEWLEHTRSWCRRTSTGSLNIEKAT